VKTLVPAYASRGESPTVSFFKPAQDVRLQGSLRLRVLHLGWASASHGGVQE
jgi:hypothetical protein